MTLSEKVSYLKGLAEGLAIDGTKPEAKIINYMIEILDDMALTVMDIDDEVAEIGAQLDEVDEDLDTLEQVVYDEDDGCGCGCDCGCDCGCGCDEDLFEVECPSCHEKIYIDSDILEDEEMDCPNCGQKLEFELDDCGEDCDCGCDE